MIKRFKNITIIFVLTVSNLWAQVEPPNYNFDLDKLQTFMPGSTLESIQSEYKGEVMFKNSNFITYRFYVSHIRYRFAILVQTLNGKVTDFYARLPSYFLHDIFHQSLINRIGKQDKYFLKNEQAIYQWNNANNFTHTYSGACTITCFPIFYAVKSNDATLGNNFKSIIEQLNKSSKPD